MESNISNAHLDEFKEINEILDWKEIELEIRLGKLK